MKRSFKSIISLLLCLIILSTTVLTSCDSVGSGNGDNASTTTATKPSESEGSENTAVLASGVTLDKTTLSLLKGESEMLVATVAPDDTTDKTLTWTSSNESVATVENGTVAAVGAGTATITVTTANGKTATCEVTVTVLSSGITLDKTALQLMESESAMLIATITPSDATNKNILWTTSDSTIATVSNGVVTAIRSGTATITATDSEGHTATCEVTVIAIEINFKTLSVDGYTAYGKVSNTTNTFSFINEISATRCAKFEVYADYECKNIIKNKIPTLQLGDNTFYILEYANDDVVGLYTVTIRRRPMYTVSFDTVGGTYIPAQTIEEDGLASEPTATKEGYTFISWDYDFNTPITSDTVITASWSGNPYTVTYDANGGTVTNPTTNVASGEQYTLETPSRTGYTFAGWYYGETPVTISGAWSIPENVTLRAEWTANTDTAYKVEHYIEKLDGSYELKYTDNLSETTDSEITPETKNYTGFTSPSAQTVTILPDGSRVVKYYYTRNSYTVTFLNDDGTEIETQILKYEQEYSFSVLSKVGYTFAWYDNRFEPFTKLSGNWTILDNIVLKAKWTANTDTPYKVLHYIEHLDGTYELKDTDNLTGTSDRIVTPVTKQYAGFKSPVVQAVTVLPDGSSIVEYYYTRIGYTITFVTNGGEEIPSQILKYEEKIEQTPIRSGFTFGGWFTDVNLSTSIETVPYNNTTLYITVYAYWLEENKPTDFSYTSATSLTIFGYSGSDTSVCVPAYIGGRPVVGISTEAFKECSILTSITIPDTVTFITSYSFYNCTNLKSISLPNGLKTIENDLFCNCTSLESITIPNTVTIIDSSAFSGCTNLKTITIPDSVTHIHGGAFQNCTNLVSVTIGNGLISIGSYSFMNCSNLINITMPNSLLYIYGEAFYACTSLESITIPNSVTSIGIRAFSNCTSLKNITLPNSVSTIGDEAFRGCTGLETIKLSTSLTSIGYAVFWECSSLSYIAIPDGVTSIGWLAFYGCQNLISISIPNSVTYIEAGAFKNCTRLEGIIIPDDVTFIGNQAFYNCESLVNINIPNGVTSIIYDTFYGCTSLKNVTIPNGVTDIGEQAFYGCTSLESITIPNSVTSLGRYAFTNCTSLKNITLGEGITTIEYRTFDGCTSLVNVTIPDSVTVIGAAAFYACTSLESVTIPNSVTSIISGGFYRCENLKRIDFIGTIQELLEMDDNLLSWIDRTFTIYCTNGTISPDGTIKYDN